MDTKLPPDIIDMIFDIAKVSIDTKLAFAIKPKKIKIETYVKKKLDEMLTSRENCMKSSKCEVDFVAKCIKATNTYNTMLQFEVYRFNDYAFYEFVKYRFEYLPQDDFSTYFGQYDLHTGEALNLWEDTPAKIEKLRDFEHQEDFKDLTD